MVVAVKAAHYNNVRGLSPRKVAPVMAQSIPGRRVQQYLPRNLLHAMAVTRLANADQARQGVSRFRYIIDCPIHEAVDPKKLIRVLDSLEGETILVSELFERLPESLQKRVLHSYL